MLSKACIVGIYQRKLEEIARLGVELLTLVPPSWRDERGEMPLERVYTQGYRLETLPIARNGDFHLHFYPDIGRRIRDFQPHIVHIDEEPYNLATWHALYHARRAGAKTLFFSWQNLVRHYPPPFGWGERWTLRSVDYAIAGTESAAEVWRAKGYAGPLAVIPQFGVDPDVFAPPRQPRPDGAFVVGFAGRLVEEKGGADLIAALAQVKGDWRLAIAGDGPQKDALLAQAERLGIEGRVKVITLPSTDMPAYYRGLDALAIPSRTRPNWKEQFGRVIVEAMACGVPVVGSNSGAIPDVLGDAGRIVPEGDVPALAAALRDLLRDPARRGELGARGRQRVLERYTQAQVAAQTVAVYRAMLAD